MARILVSDKVNPECIGLLKKRGIQVDYEPEIKADRLAEIISLYDGLIVRSRTKVTKEIIDNGILLKVIGRAGVGLDNVDVEYAKTKGIAVVNTPEAPTSSVAELTIGLMLSVARQITISDSSMKSDKWIKSKLTGMELNGKTLGIIGLGRIGSRVAGVAYAMGMSILVHTPHVSEQTLKALKATNVDLDTLLSRSDVVTLHVPLKPETHHLINAETIGKMKKGAILVNTSRGEVVDETALAEALKSGKIFAAGLDVYTREPPEDSSLTGLANVVCTPHIGSETVEANLKVGIMIAEKVDEALRDR